MCTFVYAYKYFYFFLNRAVKGFVWGLFISWETNPLNHKSFFSLKETPKNVF